MTQKICFDCFHKLFPDKLIRKVTLGRQCVVCKAQTDRTEQMIPVEAEDILLVKQIAQVPRRVLHRTERHADRRVAVRVAARGAGQVGRDAGQAGPRDPPCSGNERRLDKAQPRGWSCHSQQTVRCAILGLKKEGCIPGLRGVTRTLKRSSMVRCHHRTRRSRGPQPPLRTGWTPRAATNRTASSPIWSRSAC